MSYRTFSGGGNPTDQADYVYDALNRLVQETELHPGFNGDKHVTQLSYLGQGRLETEEQQSSKNSGNTLSIKDFTYDVYGHRLAMTSTPYTNGVAGTPTTSTDGYDVHGSVSQLVDANGNTTTSYGYTPYGQSDSQLSQGDTDRTAVINPFRYSAQRVDTGSGTLEMGVRRFGPDIAHFLTPDFFYGSLADLSLSIDLLTQNRYDLAGGNPISFKESTGHQFIEDGGGGASSYPQPQQRGGSFWGSVGQRASDFGARVTAEASDPCVSLVFPGEIIGCKWGRWAARHPKQASEQLKTASTVIGVIAGACAVSIVGDIGCSEVAGGISALLYGGSLALDKAAGEQPSDVEVALGAVGGPRGTPSLKIPSRQFGAKVAQHGPEFGLDPSKRRIERNLQS